MVFQKLLEWYKKCIAAGGDYFKGDKSFMCVLSIKVPLRKKSGNLFDDPRIQDVLKSYHFYRSSFMILEFLTVYTIPVSTFLESSTGGLSNISSAFLIKILQWEYVFSEIVNMC